MRAAAPGEWCALVNLEHEAREILEDAAAGHQIEVVRLVRFARAFLTSEDATRSALQVVENTSDPFTPRRALEVAAFVVRR